MGPLTTPLTVTLRDYQTDAIAKVREAYKENRRVLFVLPTGGGKTVIFAYIVAAYAAAGKRVVVVAHRREICTQISEKLNDLGVEHDLVMPGERMKGLSIQVGMVQTLARRVERPGKWGLEKPDLLVIDEAHHSAAGSWQKVMTIWPRIQDPGCHGHAPTFGWQGAERCFRRTGGRPDHGMADREQVSSTTVS